MNEELSVRQVELIKPKTIDLQLTQLTDQIRIIGEKAIFEDHLEKGWSALFLPNIGETAKLDVHIWMVYKAAGSATANADLDPARISPIPLLEVRTRDGGDLIEFRDEPQIIQGIIHVLADQGFKVRTALMILDKVKEAILACTRMEEKYPIKSQEDVGVTD